VKRQFLQLAALRFAKLGLTVAALLVYARTFGIGIQMDSWVFASGVAASVGVALWGPVNEIVRSRFVRQMAEVGESQARASATSLLVFSSSVSVLVCAVLLAGAPRIVDVLYAAGDPAGKALVLRLFVVMLPSIVVGQVIGLATAYMNCYDVIYTPEFLGIAAAVLNLGCVLLLTPQLGIHSLAVGYYLGAALSLAVVLRFLWARGFLRDVAALRTIIEDARGALLFAAPLFLSYGAGQLYLLLEKYLASLMGVGVMSSVNYASQIKSTLQAVLASVTFSLIVPRLTRAAAQPGGEAFARMLRDAQRMAMAFLLLVLPFLFGAADGLAALLFGTASTSPDSMHEVTLLIRLYAVALVPVVMYLVYGVALLAQQRGRAYAALGVVAQLLAAFLCLLLFRSVGAAVFPTALFVSHLVAALVMLQRIDVERRKALLAEAGGFALTLAAGGAAVLLAYRALVEAWPSGWWALAWTAAGYGSLVLVLLLVYKARAARRGASPQV
jgi:peptidoglycan biosynthesis protein MviN/MurJ (putative lipid II flippase)